MLLNDIGYLGQPYRFPNTILLSHLNTALREVYSLRPDAYVGNFTQGVLSSTSVVTYDVTDLGISTAFPLDDKFFFAPVVNFIAGRAELSDDEFVDSGRAMMLLQSFVAKLTKGM